MSIQFDELDSLTEIDPAPAPNPSAHTDPDAQQLLHTILAEPTDATTGPSPMRRKLRPWLLAGAAAAVAATAVAIPAITADQAYSSWTSTPIALSGPHLSAAAQECGRFWQDTGLLADADLTAATDLAEQRGDFRYVLMSTPTHHLDCLIRADGGRGPGSAGYWAGSASEHQADEIPPPNGLTAVSVALVERDDVALWFFHARVGAEAEEAVVHLPGHGDVQATVQGGYVAAWAPEVDPDELAQGVGVTLYLADGDAIRLSPDQVREIQTAG